MHFYVMRFQKYRLTVESPVRLIFAPFLVRGYSVTWRKTVDFLQFELSVAPVPVIEF